MRKLIFALCLLLSFSYCIAQNKHKRFVPEHFQAELEQYITKKACLTPKEAAAFFPIYSEMQRKQREIHDEMKSLKRIKPTTDSECRKNIEKRDECDIKMKQIQKTYHEKFMKVLPPQKVYDVLKAEDRFHRQIFKRTVNRHRDKVVKK